MWGKCEESPRPTLRPTSLQHLEKLCFITKIIINRDAPIVSVSIVLTIFQGIGSYLEIFTNICQYRHTDAFIFLIDKC